MDILDLAFNVLLERVCKRIVVLASWWSVHDDKGLESYSDLLINEWVDFISERVLSAVDWSGIASVYLDNGAWNVAVAAEYNVLVSIELRLNSLEKLDMIFLVLAVFVEKPAGVQLVGELFTWVWLELVEFYWKTCDTNSKYWYKI